MNLLDWQIQSWLKGFREGRRGTQIGRAPRDLHEGAFVMGLRIGKTVRSWWIRE